MFRQAQIAIELACGQLAPGKRQKHILTFGEISLIDQLANKTSDEKHKKQILSTQDYYARWRLRDKLRLPNNEYFGDKAYNYTEASLQTKYHLSDMLIKRKHLAY